MFQYRWIRHGTCFDDMTMNKRTLLICALATVLSAMLARAVPTNITLNSTGTALLNDTGVANEEQYGQPNNNPTSNLTFLNNEIRFWNMHPTPTDPFTPDLPAANGTVARNDERLDLTTFIAPAGFNYVVFHFGAGPAGGGGISRSG